MLTAIEAGYISAVFVKDLSRVGRNYIEVGKLTEEFFPQYDVRLVAVSDGVDSDEGDNEFTPFRNIMNEWYAKDISKKRKIVNKMKGNAGIPLSQPPYGYKIQHNVERDKKNIEALNILGWAVITVWECELKKKVREKRLEQLCAEIKGECVNGTD